MRSPTFVLENRFRGRVEIRHLDLYRLQSSEEDLEDDWEESEGVVIVEWAERVADPPRRAIWIDLEGAGGATRTIRLTWDRAASLFRTDPDRLEISP